MAGVITVGVRAVLYSSTHWAEPVLPRPLEDRVLLVTTYLRTNLTTRQLAPLFGISKSAADRIIDHLGPRLALQPCRRFRKDTMLIVDGIPVPTPDHSIAEQSKIGLGLAACTPGTPPHSCGPSSSCEP
ncbi:hypothetical protein GCM10022232_92920 [Streptomyces plumbiresistens]|uniref:Transposase Helix-turn-helix domain-containing protein n=1 Tax=Streptomyces plumbiresistens TaxID=511811 RepID=A0ABP7TX86_9ACTN